MACRGGCSDFRSGACDRCWLPFGTICRDTSGFIDRSVKFRNHTALTGHTDRILAVVPVRELADIVLSYMPSNDYQKYDIVDGLDDAGSVYSAVILDRWRPTGTTVDLFLLRYIGYNKFFDNVVGIDAVMPRSDSHPEPTCGAKATVIRRRTTLPIDRRWPTFDDLPSMLFWFWRPYNCLNSYNYGETLYKIYCRF